jgi:hypothetical protein
VVNDMDVHAEVRRMGGEGFKAVPHASEQKEDGCVVGAYRNGKAHGEEGAG